MRSRFLLVVCLIVPASVAAAQDQNSDSPVAVVSFSWERVRIPGQKLDNNTAAPARAMIPENKYHQRTAREQQSKGAIDPNDYTVDGRSAALEKNVQEARSVKSDDVSGFRYVVHVRNDADRKVDILFLEYRFTEFANRNNVVRRHLLCSVKAKPGEKKVLITLSLLGPSEVINAEGAAGAAQLFEEKVLINRIEFSDGAILQRSDWKFADVKHAVDRVTATSWGKDVCRLL